MLAAAAVSRPDGPGTRRDRRRCRCHADTRRAGAKLAARREAFRSRPATIRAQYNGLKLFSAKGRVLTARGRAKVLDRYRKIEAGDVGQPAADRPGTITAAENMPGEHSPPSCGWSTSRRFAGNGFACCSTRIMAQAAVAGAPLLDELGCQPWCSAARLTAASTTRPSRRRKTWPAFSGQVPAAGCPSRVLHRSRCRSAGHHRRAWPLSWRGIHVGIVRRSRAAAAARPDRDELFDQPDVARTWRQNTACPFIARRSARRTWSTRCSTTMRRWVAKGMAA